MVVNGDYSSRLLIFVRILATDRKTNKQMDNPNA